MISRPYQISLALVFCSLLPSTSAADLVLDSNLSSATITIANVSQTSATSGTVLLATTPVSSPFSTAQIQDFDLVLDDGLNFVILGGLVTLTSAGGELSIEMVTPGSAGTVTGGQFDQLGNTVAATGTLALSDPFNLAGGSGPFELGSLGSQMVDFNDITISSVGEIVTIDAQYVFGDTISGIDVTVSGRIVASGSVAVPEPSTMLIVGACLLTGLARRRRRV